MPKMNRLFCALYYTFVILSEQVGNKITVDKKKQMCSSLQRIKQSVNCFGTNGTTYLKFKEGCVMKNNYNKKEKQQQKKKALLCIYIYIYIYICIVVYAMFRILIFVFHVKEEL